MMLPAPTPYWLGRGNFVGPWDEEGAIEFVERLRQIQAAEAKKQATSADDGADE